MPQDGMNTDAIISNFTPAIPAIASTSITWMNWNTILVQQVLSPMTTSGTSAWVQWNTASVFTCQNGVSLSPVLASPVVVMTPEQIALAQAAQEEANRLAAIEAERQRMANEKAKKLLVEHLSPQQQKTYDEKRYFDVDIEGRTYRIHHGSHGNVRLLGTGEKTGKEVTKYCIQPDGVPVGDVLLAQKLLLEADEKEFLRIANATQI
jgi:hypothetical protein